VAAQAIRIPISFGALKPLFVATGLTPSRCYIEAGPDLVRVRMGWSFFAEVPRASIRSVAHAGDKKWSIGVHGWRGRWLVNGASGPIVGIEIDPPARGRALGFPLRLRELQVSVDDPDAVITALSAP
jgi:hypothetical protein